MIPRCFEGQTVVVVASGPSLTPDDVLYCAARAPVAVVNDNYRLAPWAHLLYAADYAWWDHHDGVAGFQGDRWTCDERAAQEFGLNLIPVAAKGEGLSHDPSQLHRLGGNSGGQCLNLVYLMGAKRILLLGFDMQVSNNRRHWFGDHPSPLNRSSNYPEWRRAVDACAKDAAAHGLEIINCSRLSALQAYPRARIADCL